MQSILAIMLPAFCECLVLVGIHSYLGLHVIKRKVIFVDLAFAQITALGTLIAFLFGIPPHTPAAFGFALALAALAAGLFSLCRTRDGRIPQEALIGLVYAVAAATSILLIDKAPHGAEHFKEIMTGSILWVSWPEIGRAAGIYALVGLFHYVFRDRFLLISNDPDRAWREGLNVRFWDFLFYLSFGVVITVSVDVAGVLIVFVFLVAPAILALLVADRLRSQLFVGWGLGVVVTTLGLLLAYVKDLSTGPAVIATYGAVMLVFAAIVHVHRGRPRRAAFQRVLGIAGLFGLAGLALFGAGKWLAPDSTAEASHATETAAPAGFADEVDRILLQLEANPEDGATLAVAFLRSDPPPFFRSRVVEELNRRMEPDPGFVSGEDVRSAANQEALRRVTLYFQVEGR